MSGGALKSQAAYLFASRVVAYGFTALSPIILTRLMPADDFGLYRQILLIVVIGQPLVSLSIPHSLYYFYPRVNKRIRELLSQTLLLQTVSGLVGVTVFAILCYAVGILPEQMGPAFVWPLALILLFEGMALTLDHIFVIEKKPRAVLVVLGATSILRLVLVVVGWLWSGSVLGMAFALVVLGAVRLMTLLTYVARQHQVVPAWPERGLLKDQLRFALPFAASGVVGVIGGHFDKVVVTGLMSAAEFAVYSLGGLGMLSGVTLACGAVGQASLPRLNELVSEENWGSVKTLWHTMVSFNAVIILPALSLAFVFAPDLVSLLYTDKFIRAADVLRINVFTLVMMVLAYGRVPQALGKTPLIFKSNLARAIVAVILSLILIPRFGMLGGAVAAVTASWVNGLIQVHAAKRALKLSFRGLLPWGNLLPVMAGSLVVAAGLGGLAQAGLPGLVILFLALAAYGVFVLVGVHALGLFRLGDFRAMMRQI